MEDGSRNGATRRPTEPVQHDHPPTTRELVYGWVFVGLTAVVIVALLVWFALTVAAQPCGVQASPCG